MGGNKIYQKLEAEVRVRAAIVYTSDTASIRNASIHTTPGGGVGLINTPKSIQTPFTGCKRRACMSMRTRARTRAMTLQRHRPRQITSGQRRQLIREREPTIKLNTKAILR